MLAGRAGYGVGVQEATDPGPVVKPYALDVIRHWPPVAREAAYHVILVHRQPHVVEPDVLEWHAIGPWKRVTVTADAKDADDVVEAVIEATVPTDRRGDLEAVAEEFRVRVGSGDELAVRGRDLAGNVITLNIVHELVEGTLTPEEARDRRALDMADLRAGRPPVTAETCRFADDAPHGEPRTVGSRRLASDLRARGRRTG